MRLKRLDNLFRDCETRKSRAGNTIKDLFILDGDRYRFDFDLVGHGWQQYDTEQDAWYFGIWVCEELRQVLTYAEGDLSLVECETEEGFQKELAIMAEFYGSPPPAVTVIDFDKGTVTDHYDEGALFGREI